MALTSGPGPKTGGWQPLAEINITPFVDVMLVLLVIFMVTAPLMMSGVPLELPTTEAERPAQTSEPVVVSLTASGEVFLGEEEVPQAALKARLARLRGESGDAVVYVRADRALDYGAVVERLGEIGRAGFSRVSLIAQAPAG
jgi:biopolymer transport protein TolR